MSKFTLKNTRNLLYQLTSVFYNTSFSFWLIFHCFPYICFRISIWWLGWPFTSSHPKYFHFYWGTSPRCAGGLWSMKMTLFSGNWNGETGFKWSPSILTYSSSLIFYVIGLNVTVPWYVFTPKTYNPLALDAMMEQGAAFPSLNPFFKLLFLSDVYLSKYCIHQRI